MSEDPFISKHAQWTVRVVVVFLGLAAVFLAMAFALWGLKLVLRVWAMPVTLAFVGGVPTKSVWQTLPAWIASWCVSGRGKHPIISSPCDCDHNILRLECLNKQIYQAQCPDCDTELLPYA